MFSEISKSSSEGISRAKTASTAPRSFQKLIWRLEVTKTEVSYDEAAVMIKGGKKRPKGPISKGLVEEIKALSELKKTDEKMFADELYSFIQTYVIENADHEYICKSCGFYLNIKKYIQDGKFDDDSKKFIVLGMTLDKPLEDIPEYEKYKGSIRSIDKLIEILAARLKQVSEVKVPYGDTKKQQLKIARIEKIKASIKELQLKKDYEAFIDEANFELNLMTNATLEKYDNDELLDARKAVTFYARILEDRLISKKSLKENYKEFSRLQTDASEKLAAINEEIEDRAIQVAEDVNVSDILAPQEEAHVLSKWFRSISQSNHPVIKSFYKLMSRQKDKLYNINN